MLKSFLSFSLALIVTGLAPPSPADSRLPTPDSPICPADLPSYIDSILTRPELRTSLWGILIQPLGSNQSLYSLSADKLFIPASNVKLLTSAAALLSLPPDFTILTPVYAQGEGARLTSLTVVGKGDPTMTVETLQNLAQGLRSRGVTIIDNLILADGYISSGINPTWEWEDILFDYGVPASGFVLNRNSVTLKASPQSPGQPLKLTWSDELAGSQWRLVNRTFTSGEKTAPPIKIEAVLGDSTLIVSGGLPASTADSSFDIAIPNSERYFLDSLRLSLQKSGITVKSVSITNDAPPAGQILTEIKSPYLPYFLQKVNKDSDNLVAETLLVLVGGRGEGLRAVKEQLARLGLNPQTYSLKDGSGLSRQNFVSPASFVTILQAMNRNSNGRLYRDSLAVGGKDGTLAARFKDSSIAVRAKTGTLTGVIALSGYVDTPTYGTLVFSTIVNNSGETPGTIRQGIDDIINLLGRLKTCPGNSSEKR